MPPASGWYIKTIYLLGYIWLEPVRYLILDESGNKLKSFTLENNKETLETLPERLESLSISKDNLLTSIEAAGSLRENSHSFFKDKGFRIVLDLSISIEELEKQMNDILSPSDKDGDSPAENNLSMKGVGEKTPCYSP